MTAFAVVVLVALDVFVVEGAHGLRGRHGSQDLRDEVCQYCKNRCQISCFAGTCAIGYTDTTQRYGTTNQCFSCEPGDSQAFSQSLDMTICDSANANGPMSLQGANPQNSSLGGVQAPAIIVPSLTLPPEHMAIISDAATAADFAIDHLGTALRKVNSVRDMVIRREGFNGSQANPAAPPGSLEIDAIRHEATKIQMQAAFDVKEAGHQAWLIAKAKYDEELKKLHEQQLRVDQAAAELNEKSKLSKAARAAYWATAKAAETAAIAATVHEAAVANRELTEQQAEEVGYGADLAKQQLKLAYASAMGASGKLKLVISS
eukprot:TRINITY_DN63125_c0_g1_i1.p1 TRINITY_DN63125_c0_g1~~TRINITY_DN63125_c0_g1_i1.p1  ORF type:complete len:318 (-),score=61.40 TRINITY_DN63125_c0_g1_i1:76-1029(-)